MPYTDRFTPTDNLITHLNGVIGGIADAAILANYAGFLSVSAVTVYELAIKDIFESFARRKNNTFGDFVQTHFERINGRIKLDSLKKEHIKTFGDRYVKKFNTNLDAKEVAVFAAEHLSVKNCYTNLITCRHEYVHGGNPTLTLNEVISNYAKGKEVIHSLDLSMRR